MNDMMIGVDLAKSVFQLHGTSLAEGKVLFRKKLTRIQFEKFMKDTAACLIAMEACGSANFWVRQLRDIKHFQKKLIDFFGSEMRQINKL